MLAKSNHGGPVDDQVVLLLSERCPSDEEFCFDSSKPESGDKKRADRRWEIAARRWSFNSSSHPLSVQSLGT